MERRLKVLHVVFFLEPGGMENGIVNLSKGLDPDIFDIHYCCLERPGAFVERLPNPQNVHVLGKPPGFSFKTVRDLGKLIGKLQPHLLHSHNLGPLIYSGLGSFGGQRCPILQGEHSLLTPEEITPRRLRQRRWLYRACREIHCVSNQLQDQLVELGFPKQKISTILNGVDTERFIAGDRADAWRNIGLNNLITGDQVIGIVGRFGAFKRHSVLIEAFNQIAIENPRLHLLIVGDGGPEKERVHTQVTASPVASRIHLCGYQKDVRPFYQAMDLLVVPSENEGLSNAVLEAMACSVPVLAHDICGNSEIITPGVDGWIADLGTPEKLAAHLKNILAIPSELDKLKQMARTKVLKRFSMAAMVEQYAALYKRNARTR